MKARVYIETSIPSYLTARPSNDLRAMANQSTTAEWWNNRRHAFDVFMSEMDYLLTWNCSHIANAAMRPKIEAVCRRHGYEPPIICTPLELMED